MGVGFWGGLDKKLYKWFDAVLKPFQEDKSSDLSSGNYEQLMELSIKIYEKGYSGLDLMKYIEQKKYSDEIKKYQMLLVFNKIKKEFRNENLFILFILNFILSSEHDLENISFI